MYSFFSPVRLLLRITQNLNRQLARFKIDWIKFGLAQNGSDWMNLVDIPLHSGVARHISSIKKNLDQARWH
jgi:hypothetical protein